MAENLNTGNEEPSINLESQVNNPDATDIKNFLPFNEGLIHKKLQFKYLINLIHQKHQLFKKIKLEMVLLVLILLQKNN